MLLIEVTGPKGRCSKSAKLSQRARIVRDVSAVPVYPWVTTGRRVLYATAPEHAVASLRTLSTND